MTDSLNNALEIMDSSSPAASSGLAATFGQGGPVLWILLLLSVTALAIILVKLWQFSRLKLNASEPTEQALHYWHQYDPKQALALLQASPQPTAQLLVQTLQGLAVPHVDLSLLREELTRFASAQLEQLRSWLRALEVIAALSPLLGLLGTVLRANLSCR